MIGKVAGITFFKYAESVAATITSVFIIKAGIDIISSSAKMLMDAAPDDHIIEQLEKVADAVSGVEELDWLKCRTVGRGILVDLAVEVDPDLSIKEGHEIDASIKNEIQRKFKTVLDVQVQINPDKD